MYSHCVEDGESEILRNVGSIVYVYHASSLSRGSRFKIFVSIEKAEYVTTVGAPALLHLLQNAEPKVGVVLNHLSDTCACYTALYSRTVQEVLPVTQLLPPFV
jgi:hypothetical protein